MTVGERIKARRKELDISVDELAVKLGKNRATVYRYEGDEIENMPLSVLEPLAAALQTTPWELMGWIEKDSGIDRNERSDARLFKYFEAFNQDEIDEIIKYAEFIKSKRRGD